MPKGQFVVKETVSKRTCNTYRAVWYVCEGKRDRLVTLDWFKMCCIFGGFEKVKAGDYPVVLCEVNNE